MKFAENNRISQRQLYRQIVIAFIAPLILCLFGNRKTLGLGGLAGTAAALAAVLFYVIFLVRLRYAFARPCKTAGVVWGWLTALFFLIYCILGAAFLLNLLGEIVAVSLGTGIGENGFVCSHCWFAVWARKRGFRGEAEWEKCQEAWYLQRLCLC